MFEPETHKKLMGFWYSYQVKTDSTDDCQSRLGIKKTQNPVTARKKGRNCVLKETKKPGKAFGPIALRPQNNLMMKKRLIWTRSETNSYATYI